MQGNRQVVGISGVHLPADIAADEKGDCTEKSAFVLVTCSGIQQLHFCICNGISGAEREIYEKENDGTAGDPYRDSGIFPLRDRYREEEKRCYYP